MRSFNIKALFKLSGCVVEKLVVEDIGVQVKMRSDARCRPCCPNCHSPLSEHRKGSLAVFDLPLADKTAVWITLPAIQGRCPRCRYFVTQRPPEVHPLRNAIALSYILKEDFRWIYSSCHGVTEAIRKLRRWCRSALASGILPLCRFAKGLLKDLSAAAAYFPHRISSGLIEGFNNQIARLIHRSCGITNLDYLFHKMRAQSLQQT